MIYFMLKVENLTKIFKSDLLTQPFVALKDVSFEIPTGSMVGFLGANGAGKTTSLKIIMDFIRPTSGEIKFDSKLGISKQKIFEKIGYLPERPYFYPHLTGQDFLLLLGQLSNLTRAQVQQAIKDWAPRFKIDHALPRELKTYSKGMLQRIGFLSCVIHNPDFIILDEPLSGLDPIGRKELKDVIVDVYKSGKTVFFSTHIVSDVEEICDRVIFLQQGELKYAGSVGDLISNNLQSDYLIKIQGIHSDLSEHFKNLRTLPGQITEISVTPDQKKTTIESLMKLNKEIVAIEQKKLSLEEIFYRGRT
jgi:ABC-2 type transport system ATP-binding protein